MSIFVEVVSSVRAQGFWSSVIFFTMSFPFPQDLLLAYLVNFLKNESVANQVPL